MIFHQSMVKIIAGIQTASAQGRHAGHVVCNCEWKLECD